ncbi:MAG: hypothetical protein NC399_06875 [Muribaculum sp.]|nr:hypothetical protein [Muribaculum sp.]
MAFNFFNYSTGSSLFGSSSGSGMSSLYSMFADRSAIKNGSYGKLLKSYYNTNKTSSTSSSKTAGSNNVIDKILEEKRNPKVSKDVQEANANLTSGLSTLKTSVSTLQNSKTYEDTVNGQSAASKTVSAVKDYVTDYNNVISAAKGSTLTNKTAYVANMMNTTAANADQLSEIGIRVNSDGTLELNEEKLKTADISKVKEIFSPDNIMSYGSTVASRLRFASAGSTASTSKDKTETDSTTASSAAASLKTDSNALASDKLYEKVKDQDGNETDEYDVANIFATAKSFVGNYNKMFDAAKSSSNSGVLANLSYIREKTANNADALKQFGISVDENGKMKIDEDTFKKSDMSKVQKFFKDYGSSIATNASLVDYYMTTQANAADGYTSTGAYNVQGSARYADTV